MDGARQRVGRRVFLRQAGQATAGLLVVSALPACTDAVDEELTQAPTGQTPASSHPTSAGQPSDATGPVDWRRVDLDVVSAYVLVRDVEAAIVDTGVPGSELEIADALVDLGLNWNDVAHVILTHRHPDHVGSVAAVLGQAPNATVYAGAGDAPAIVAPVPVTVVDDGDSVFGLRIITTPGHTPGHISVLDEDGGLLIAGDALAGGNDTVRGPEPRFTADVAMANASVGKLAGFEFDGAVFGHGEPVTGNADAQVEELAARLSLSPSKPVAPRGAATPTSVPSAPRPSRASQARSERPAR